MSVLMKSVSGIRGIIGETLTPELIVSVAASFAKYSKYGTIVVGRDSRPTGELVSNVLISTLSMCGCNVIDLGIVPTPTVQIMVENLQANGGIVISASHNPIEWNAFKLITNKGTFLNANEVKIFFSYLEKAKQYKKWDKIGKISQLDAQGIHIQKVIDTINKKKIKKKKYKVALDSVNGAGSLITQKLLHQLNCKVYPIYCELSGIFPRVAEPLPEHLGDLSKQVVFSGADIGFAQDPDADRLAIVDERGNPIGEENTIALVSEHLLSKEKGRVVINLSTTKAVSDIAESHGVKCTRTKVGEINVVDDMRKKGARIGGEGNGGVISPEVHLGRDSLVGIGYILEMMAERDKSISELVSELPQYVMKKGKVALNKKKPDSIIKRFLKKYQSESTSTIDGLRIDFVKHPEFSGGWVHLRSSNTEPIFRIIAEGKTEKQCKAIYKTFEKEFKK